jgi:catalase
MLAKEATARDFVADAFAHMKFIGYAAAAEPLLKKAGVAEDRDEGFLPLGSADDAAAFVTACRKLRFWPREARVKQV